VTKGVVRRDKEPILPAMGYLQGSLVEKLYRDQRVLQIYEGTSEILKLVIQRESIPS
jgi:alkylation response protein AidB-like acyl-CoA dehydrogenase